jgi:hypothetical protein
VSHTITRGVLVVSHTQSSAMIHSARMGEGAAPGG